MSAEFPHFATAIKRLTSSHDWEEIDHNYLSWVGPLDIDGVTILGLQVRLQAHILHPNEAVMAQLEYRPPGGRPQQLIRAEWRPLAPHNNKNRGPSEWKFRQFQQTHVHRFQDNWFPAEERMLNPNLPIAIPIQDVDSYAKFLDICVQELIIENMSIVPMPPWNSRML